MKLCEKIIETKTVFSGKIFTVTDNKALLADGSVSGRELVLHSGGAGILPVFENGDIMLVRQYRSGAGRVMLEICAGKLEKGEDPKDCAKRELLEELGIFAKNITELAYVLPTPAYCSEKTYIFLATDLEKREQRLDSGEFLETVTMPLEEAVGLVMSGQITDAKTQIAVLKAERILKNWKK